NSFSDNNLRSSPLAHRPGLEAVGRLRSEPGGGQLLPNLLSPLFWRASGTMPSQPGVRDAHRHEVAPASLNDLCCERVCLGLLATLSRLLAGRRSSSKGDTAHGTVGL